MLALLELPAKDLLEVFPHAAAGKADTASAKTSRY